MISGSVRFVINILTDTETDYGSHRRYVFQVECTEQSELCKTEGILRYPTLNFYHGGRMTESRHVGIEPDYHKKASILRAILGLSLVT